MAAPPFGSGAAFALLPEEAGARPAVLMGHGGESGGRHALPGVAGPPAGRRRPVLWNLCAPGRHSARSPAPHSGAATALEARASSDQGTQAGMRDVEPRILTAVGLRGCGCCVGGLRWGFVRVFPFPFISRTLHTHTPLHPVHLPAVRVLRVRAPPPVASRSRPWLPAGCLWARTQRALKPATAGTFQEEPPSPAPTPHASHTHSFALSAPCGGSKASRL